MKIKGMRWYIAGLLMLATMVNYLDRNTLGIVVASDSFSKEFHLDAQHYAYILMAFQISYAVMQPIAGRIIDFVGTRMGFAMAVIWWSIANMLHAVAGGPVQMGIFRGLLGVGEAGNFPGAAKTVSEWFAPRERTIATGIFNMGSSIGGTIAPPLVAFLIIAYGWRSAFIVTGAVGFVWVALWLLLYRAPQFHPNITQEERDYIVKMTATEPVEEKVGAGVWKLVLTSRNFWALAAARFFSEPAWQTCTYWIPIYFKTVRGEPFKEVAMYALFTFLAADLGSLVGGLLSPLFSRMGLTLLNARRMAVTVGALLMPAAAFISFTDNNLTALLCFCITAFAHQAISATLLTLPADLFAGRSVATANGLSGGCGYLGGVLFTGLTGWLVMHYSYTPVFVIMGLLDLIGVAALWIFIRRPQVFPGTREI